MALKKYCNSIGCNRLIPITEIYCPIHSRSKAERNTDYDRTRRDKKAKAFYNSKAWEMARAATFARDNGIDIYIYFKEGRVVPATMVHHIVELKEDYSKRCDLDNLISLSERTHEGPIKKAYKNNASKEHMQRELRKCIEKWQSIREGRSEKF